MQIRPQYLPELNRSTFEWLLSEAQYDRNQLVKPKVSVAIMGDDERARTGMTAFIGIVDAADSLDCIVEDTPVNNGREVKVTNINTKKSATLSVQYEGQMYSPSIMLGTHREVSLKKDTAKKLRELIVDYLTGRKKTSQIPISRPEKRPAGVVDDDDRYAHLVAEFGE